MKYEQPHISINSAPNGEITIEIDDTELFNVIEDHLIEECSIEYEYMTQSHENKPYIMHFLTKYSFEQLKNAIRKLDKIEIDRIYKLNN
jgi:phage-related protein